MCEKKWTENLKWLECVKVKYLLIAEAPPWSTPEDDVNYFYNNFDRTKLCSSCSRCFGVDDVGDRGLKELAERGFLLVDSLPFAMKYNSDLRREGAYTKLVEGCKSFLLEHINNERIHWDGNVKLAFAFKLNGEAVQKAFSEGIELPNGQCIKLGDELIAADKSYRWFPSPEKLKKIFGV